MNVSYDMNSRRLAEAMVAQREQQMGRLRRIFQGFTDHSAAPAEARTETFTIDGAAYYHVTPGQWRELMALAPADIQALNGETTRTRAAALDEDPPPDLDRVTALDRLRTGLLSLQVLADAQDEATRAHAKHAGTSMLGDARDGAGRLAVLAEEVAEAADEAWDQAVGLLARSGRLMGQVGRIARELNDDIDAGGSGEGRPEKLYAELIQVMAMAGTWAERLRRIMSTWRLEGYDTFAGEDYPLGDPVLDGLEPSYPSYEAAMAGARERLAGLERAQPSASSGGQAPGGIQDRVYIVHPGGRRERVTG